MHMSWADDTLSVIPKMSVSRDPGQDIFSPGLSIWNEQILNYCFRKKVYYDIETTARLNIQERREVRNRPRERPLNEEEFDETYLAIRHLFD